MSDNGGRKVVITGMGAITPIGNTVEDFWQSCLEGRSGIGICSVFDHSAYPAHLAAEVNGFDPQDYMDRREARRMGRFSQFAVAATRQAIEDAGLNLEGEDRARAGVVLGNGIGGYDHIEKAVYVMQEKGGMKIDPFFYPKMLTNMAAGHVSLVYGLKGYSTTITTACAAGTQAIGQALDVIRAGRADIVIAGGTEAPLCELGLCGFAVIRALSTRDVPPEKASCPFDAERDGFVAAEGAGILVLESLEHARSRGANIRAELAGYGACNEAHHVVAPSADGDGAARAMSFAIEDADIHPEEVDYINAHGTSTQLNDSSETMAVKKVFGEQAYRIPISSTKSMIGHAFGAAGPIESLACVRSVESGRIHPTINYEHPDPECDLDYVPNVARDREVSTVLKNSFGFGGQNACLVYKRFED